MSVLSFSRTWLLAVLATLLAGLALAGPSAAAPPMPQICEDPQVRKDILAGMKNMIDPETGRPVQGLSVSKVSKAKTLSVTKTRISCSMTVSYTYQGYSGTIRALYIIDTQKRTATIHWNY